jgi:cellulose biosynthesis protein BcsQ
VIFDFGGMIDPRVLEAIEISKSLLIPVTPSMIDVQKCAEDIAGIVDAFILSSEDFDSNSKELLINEVLNKVIIVVNKSVMDIEANSVLKQINSILLECNIKHNFKNIIIPESRALKNMHTEMQSIRQMIQTSYSPMLLKRSYNKINSSFDSLVKLL